MSDDSVRNDVNNQVNPQQAPEQRLSAILESITDGFFVCDAAWRFIYFNATAERILGIQRNEVLGKSCWEVFPSILGTELEREYRQAAAGETRAFEHFCEQCGRWLQIRCFPYQGGGISVNLLDITERKQEEETLLRERDVLQALMNGAKNSHLVYLDRDFNFVRVNETYATNCGYRPEEMIGKNHFALYPHAENEAIFARVRDTGVPFEVHDKPFEFPDYPERGVTYWDWTLSPIKDQTGKVTGLILSLFETTARKKAEEALKENEAHFRLLFDRHSAIMLLIDPMSLIILDANKAAVEFYGYSRHQLRKMTIRQINSLPPDESVELDQYLTEGKNRFITPNRLANGTVRTVEIHATSISLHHREFIFAIIHDVTERQKAEARLKEMKDELERRVEQRTLELLETQQKYLHAEKLSAIGKLSASIAHEFNNPLQGIMFVLKALSTKKVLGEEERQLLAAALGEGERIKNLIRSLQDFYRPSSGEKSFIDVHRTLDSLLLLIKSDFKSKGVALELDYAERLPQIFAVADQIKQVLLNLLTNAAEACTQVGGVITVRTRQEGDKVAVVIQDTGVGITPEGMGQIFRPFYTTKPGIKGIGLGLSISYGIVKNHGGEILVTSRPGEGATFTMLLPIMLDSNRNKT